MNNQPPLHAHTCALHEHLLPTDGKARTDRTQKLHDLAEPLHDAFEQVEDELRAIRRKLRKAITAETHMQGTAFFERIKQTCDAADRQMTNAREELSSLTATMAQLDRYALEWKASNDSWHQRQEPPKEP